MRKSVILAAIFLSMAVAFAGCNSSTQSSQGDAKKSEETAAAVQTDKQKTEETSTSSADKEDVQKEDSSTAKQPQQKQAETSTVFNQLDKPKSGETIAIMSTSMGDIKVRLFPGIAPKAVENFTKLSEKGYYNGLIFHRVIKDFMIQGGDPNGNGRGGQSIWGKPFEDEFSDKLHNYRGALSMANSGPNTNGSQFFIVQLAKADENIQEFMKQNKMPEDVINQYIKIGGTPWLDKKHTVFGQVFEGMDIVDKIGGVPVGTGDKPVQNVTIKSIKIEKAK